jgi:hypothetical protein
MTPSFRMLSATAVASSIREMAPKVAHAAFDRP